MRAPRDPEIVEVSRAALLGSDYRGIAPEVLCAVGDEVRAGAALIRDTRQPERVITAPVGGRVISIDRGQRRRLDRVQIEIDDSLEAGSFEAPRERNRNSLRAFMLETGAWCSLRARPFGKIPSVDAEPEAIFVNAIETGPAASVPAWLIEDLRAEFETGIAALEEIVSAELYVCHAGADDLGLKESGRLRCAAFDGGYREGLSGFHIQKLCPIGFGGREVWQIGYQEVIALGWLLLRSTPWPWRAVSISGDGIGKPRNVALVPGASIDELLAAEAIDKGKMILAGDPLHGRPLNARPAFLAAGQRQIAVVNEDPLRPPCKSGRGGVVIPGDALDLAAPPGIYPVPLMRALQLGDAERARELGALELLEEDLAPLTRACVSGSDYGILLRRVLDRIEAQA